MYHFIGPILALVSLSLIGMGCVGGEPSGHEKSETTGKLSLPLLAKQPSGVAYRLSNAVFDIIPVNVSKSQYYNENTDAGIANEYIRQDVMSLVVYGDDDPGASAVDVNLETGQYVISLRSGWRMEKIVDGQEESVTATLISAKRQWAFINPRRTTWVVFDFGVGDKSIWRNGVLKIGINVYDDAGTGADASW